MEWVHIRKYRLEKTIENVCKQIENFDITYGKGNKFPKPLTIGSVCIVDHFIKKSHSKSFKDFILQFPQLQSNFKDLIAPHYNFESLNNDLAKWNSLKQVSYPTNNKTVDIHIFL